MWHNNSMSNRELLRRVWISERVDACEELDKAQLDRIIAQVDAEIDKISDERAAELL